MQVLDSVGMVRQFSLRCKKMTLNFALGPHNPEALQHPTKNLERENVIRERQRERDILRSDLRIRRTEVTPTNE